MAKLSRRRALIEALTAEKTELETKVHELEAEVRKLRAAAKVKSDK